MRFSTKTHHYEVRLDRWVMRNFGHLVHYSGQMHSFYCWPVCFVFARFKNGRRITL